MSTAKGNEKSLPEWKAFVDAELALSGYENIPPEGWIIIAAIAMVECRITILVSLP